LRAGTIGEPTADGYLTRSPSGRDGRLKNGPSAGSNPAGASSGPK